MSRSGRAPALGSTLQFLLAVCTMGILCWPLTASLAACPAPRPSQWQQDHFLIGAWQGPRVTGHLLQDLYPLQIAKEAGIDVILGFSGSPDDQYKKQGDVLTAAQSFNLQITLTSENMSWCGATGCPSGPGWHYCPSCALPLCECVSCLPEEYLSSSSRNAIFGYVVRDEPSASQEDQSQVFLRTRAVNQVDPTKIAFVNLYPRYWEGFTSDAAYEAYLDAYLVTPDANSRLSLVSYDSYPFMTPLPNFRPNYWTNFNQIRARLNGRPFWATVLVSQLGDLAPTVEQARFMASAAIAYGAKGISYFAYRDAANTSLFVDTLDIKKPTYDAMTSTNLYLKTVAGPVLFSSTLLKVAHSSGDATVPSENQFRPNSTPLIASLGNQLLVSVFQRTDAPNVYYLWVMNKSLGSNTTSLGLKGDLVGRVLSPAITMSVDGDTTYVPVSTSYSATSNVTSLALSLGGGEGRMFRVTSVTNPGLRHLRTDYDGDGISDISYMLNSGNYLMDFSKNGFGACDFTLQVGTGDVHPVPADYNGDGYADPSVKTDWAYDQFTGQWLIDTCATCEPLPAFGSWSSHQDGVGNVAAHPVPADYDGDGRADLSVKVDTGEWLILSSAHPGPHWDAPSITGKGNATYQPAPGDYDGDGKADMAVLAPNGLNYRWRIDYAANGFQSNTWEKNSANFATPPGDLWPVAGDYDGDGRTDAGILTDSGQWWISYASSNFSTWSGPYEGGGDPVRGMPGDYDGDGKWDLAVWDAGVCRIDLAADGFNGWNLNIDYHETGPGIGLNAVTPALTEGRDELNMSVDDARVPLDQRRVNLTLPRSTVVAFKLIDVRGRILGSWGPERMEAGSHHLSMGDLRLRASAPGMYWLKATFPGTSRTVKVIAIR